MSRPAKGPRLYAQPDRFYANGKLHAQAVWVIRDGSKKISTGIGVGDGSEPPPEALEALGQYLITRHEPARERHLSAATVLIADVISIYLRDKADGQARPKTVASRAEKLLEFWGDKTLDQVTGATCREYVQRRGKVAAARRELDDLKAAITHHRKEGLCREVVEVVLPDKGEPRTRWLTRDEVARLIWEAWRYRENPTENFAGRKSRQHVARFILLAVYTGTRAGAVCAAALQPTIGHGWIDLTAGVFHRRPEGERVTNKRKPPVRLPARLLAHMRRWKKNGQRFAVEYMGAPVLDVDRAFRNSVKAAQQSADKASDTQNRFDGVSPHTLRHTAATWLMQRGVDKWEAAGYLGMSLKTLERVYGHHHPNFQRGAAEGITRKLA